jgi:hypothetical protein
MSITKRYDSFPAWIVILSNLVSFLIYVVGFSLILKTGWLIAVFYLVFILALEYRLLSKHCVNCYYWGKTCGFGQGRISSLFFHKGDPSKFCDKKMFWKDMIPDMMVTLIPLGFGIVFLITEFTFLVLASLIFLIVLTTFGNGFIRGTLTCKFCRQRDLGCPAEQLFSKTNY